jgi:hypothetical protein
MKRFPIVRPLESIAETQPQPGFAKSVGNDFPLFHAADLAIFSFAQQCKK